MAVILRQAIGTIFLFSCIASLASPASAASSSQPVQFKVTIRDRATLILPGGFLPGPSFLQASQASPQISAKLRMGRSTPVVMLINGHRYPGTPSAGWPRVITWNGLQHSVRSHTSPLWNLSGPYTEITIIIP